MTNLSVAKRADEAAAALPHALPAWVYNHGEMTRLELERILMPSWQIVCHVNSIPKAGDYETFDLGPESVMVLRDRDGSIRGFHNVCRHRGARLLDGSGNCPATITCPYHGWTYRHDGGLIGMPVRESFPGLDRAEHGLRPVRIDIAFGFVFVCLTGDPPPVSKIWGKLADEFLPYRFEEMVPLGPDYPGDLERRLEDRDGQLPRVLSRPHRSSRTVSHVHAGLRGPSLGAGRGARRELAAQAGLAALGRRPVSTDDRRVVTHLPEDQRRCWRFYSALPNLGIDVFPDQMDFFQVLPSGPGKCIIRGAVFGLPDERREMRAIRYLSSRINTQVNNEDKWLCSRVQRGLASGSYKPGPLSQLERWMFEFHNLLRERIPEFALASPPKQFA